QWEAGGDGNRGRTRTGGNPGQLRRALAAALPRRSRENAFSVRAPGRRPNEASAAHDLGVRRMIVYRLEILGGDAEAEKAGVVDQPRRDAANEILDEARALIGTLGDEFLVGALEQTIKLARGFGFGQRDQLRQRERGARFRPNGQRQMRALVVRAVVGNLLRARAQAHDRYDERRLDRALARRRVGSQLHLVVHHALRTGHRRALAPEPRKGDVDAAGVRFQPDQQGVEEVRKRRQRQRRGELVDRRDQSRHVRALAIRGQADIGAANGDRRLRRVASVDEANRIAQISYADAVDRQ